jgi:bisanhydrobacterioruberin hydratase
MNSSIRYKYIPHFLIISSYAFGIFCIQLEMWPWLANLSWFQMLLSAGLLLYTYPLQDKSSIFKFFIASYLVGLLVEIVGVQTGVIFGEYSYGTVLGWKILETPLVIGVNWFIVTYTINQLISKFNLNYLVHSALAASVITALDYLIEPDAIRLGMWTWIEKTIPIKNYIAWWIVSFGLSYYYFNLKLKNHSFALLVLSMMVLFFVIK